MAQEAVVKLRNSQEMCQNALDGLPNRTGRSGFLKGSTGGKPKFGTKSSSFTGSLPDEMTSGARGDVTGASVPLSSAEMLKNLKLKRLTGATTSKSANVYDDGAQMRQDKVVDEKFMGELVTYIKYHSDKPGEATSDELVGQFKQQLGEGNNAIFKAMLKQVCTKSQSFSGAVIWTLKPDFSSRI